MTHCWLRAFTCTLHASNTRCEEQVEPLGWGRRMRPQGRGVGGRGEGGKGGVGEDGILGTVEEAERVEDSSP